MTCKTSIISSIGPNVYLLLCECLADFELVLQFLIDCRCSLNRV